MAAHPSLRTRNQSHQYSSHSSTTNSTEVGHVFGTTRNMGPPPLDFPPRPVEIDFSSNSFLSHNSRTLPVPSSCAPIPWDSGYFPSHTFTDTSFGPTNVSRQSHEGHPRISQQNPLAQWYAGNDGPWIPKDILEVTAEDRSHLRYTGNRASVHYSQHRPSAEGVNCQYGVPPSDSGYETRQSVGNTSVYSGDVNEGDVECHNSLGQTEFQPYHGYEGLTPQPRELRSGDPWSIPSASQLQNPALLVCQTCHKRVKTQSELKKHDLRHRKPFMCQVRGCDRTEGFSTTNDLDRHTKSKHPSTIQESSTKRYRCQVPGCKSKQKTWPRLDNFRSHLRRVHGGEINTEEKFEEMIKRGEFGAGSNAELQMDFAKDSEQHLPRSKTASRTVVRSDHPAWTPSFLNKPTHGMIRPIESSQHNGYSISPQWNEDQDRVLFYCESQEPLDTALPMELTSNLPVTNVDHIVEPHASEGNLTGQATSASASGPSIKEIIKIVLALTKLKDLAQDSAKRQNMEDGLTNGKNLTSECGSNSRASPTSIVTQVLERGVPPSASPCPKPESDITLEVLQALEDLGCSPRLSPSQPIILNPGSVASNKSNKKVTCTKCQRFQGRPCELKKHMKRHERPYGCTFTRCNKLFGSKNDWKRHENSQHHHTESWRCDVVRHEGDACVKVCFRRETFQDHLKNQHGADETTIKSKVDSCRIGRNRQARFWCGFCEKLIDLKKKGLDAWTERFDHIDDHFMGRHEFTKVDIRNWVPVDDNKPRGEVESPHSLDASPKEDETGFGHSSGSSEGSPESTHAATSPEATTSPQNPRKRSSESDDGNPRPTKRSREPVIHCCQCDFMHNPKIEERCSNCSDAHPFCDSCVRRIRVLENS